MNITNNKKSSSLSPKELKELEQLELKYSEFSKQLNLEISTKLVIKIPKTKRIKHKCFRCTLELKDNYCEGCIFQDIRPKLTKKCEICKIHGHSLKECVIKNRKNIELDYLTCFVCRSKGHVNCAAK